VGIVLLGARLSLGQVADVGGGSLALVVVFMIGTLALALVVGRVAGLPPRLAMLIGVGTAVCGNSAILATAPVIGAEDREVAYAIGTITIFGTLAVFLYPLVGHALGLDGHAFGVWSGIAVNDTSQAVATGSAFSAEARDTATIVKLVRNALMAPLLVVIATAWARHRESGSTLRRQVAAAIPLFVLGFVALSILDTIGLIDPSVAALSDTIARSLILVALAGVGLGTRLQSLRAVGIRPFAVGLITATALSVLSLATILSVDGIEAD
jgi:uncharacterized integral membrane protein (TIGR00698 family)